MNLHPEMLIDQYVSISIALAGIAFAALTIYLGKNDADDLQSNSIPVKLVAKSIFYNMLSLIISAFTMTTFEGRSLGPEKLNDVLGIDAAMVGLSVMSLVYTAALMTLRLEAAKEVGEAIVRVTAYTTPILVLPFLVGHTIIRSTDGYWGDHDDWKLWATLAAMEVGLVVGGQRASNSNHNKFRGGAGKNVGPLLRNCVHKPSVFGFWYAVVIMIGTEMLLGSYRFVSSDDSDSKITLYGSLIIASSSIFIFSTLCLRTLLGYERYTREPAKAEPVSAPALAEN